MRGQLVRVREEVCVGLEAAAEGGGRGGGGGELAFAPHDVVRVERG